MKVEIKFSLFLIFLLTSIIFAATPHKKNKEGRFKLIIEDVKYQAYQTDVLVYNVTVVNSTFDVYFHIIKNFDPVFFVKLDVLRKGKTANVFKQSIEFCNSMGPPTPLGLIIKFLIEKGATGDLSCPLKPGPYAVKRCDIPVNKFIWSLPALPFQIAIDVMEKQNRKVLCRNTITGRVQHF